MYEISGDSIDFNDLDSLADLINENIHVENYNFKRLSTTKFYDIFSQIENISTEHKAGDLVFDSPSLVKSLVILADIPLSDLKDLNSKDPLIKIVCTNINNFCFLIKSCHTNIQEISESFLGHYNKLELLLKEPTCFTITSKITKIKFVESSNLFIQEDEYFYQTMNLVKQALKNRVEPEDLCKLSEIHESYPKVFNDILDKQENLIYLNEIGIKCSDLIFLIENNTSIFYYLINATSDLWKDKDFKENAIKISNQLQNYPEGLKKLYLIDTIRNSKQLRVNLKAKL